jgi:hypothetical protein
MVAHEFLPGYAGGHEGIRLALFCLVFGVGFAVLGAIGSPCVWPGLIVGAAFGLLMGAVFGGYRGRVVDFLFGPADGPDDAQQVP